MFSSKGRAGTSYVSHKLKKKSIFFEHISSHVHEPNLEVKVQKLRVLFEPAGVLCTVASLIPTY